MDPKQPARLPKIVGAIAAGLAGLSCATVFAQTTAAPAAPAGAQDVPPGVTQIEPPKDPLVERREARKRASDEYKAKKKAAKGEYKEEVGEAKQERKVENKAADSTARQEMAAPKQ
ncbi:hypothetical protein MNJPNG_03570 [Cupriavidus oxalaticus]|uniref:hypothetical protein n=1 Tax=Cupriavidus oxalaticus TaxID=96344 RepID=UPI003F735AEA